MAMMMVMIIAMITYGDDDSDYDVKMVRIMSDDGGGDYAEA